MDINRQNTTLSKSEVVNGDTGLTPAQEQTAIILATGKNIKGVADEMGLNRSTIYNWLKYPPFVCYYNRQCADNKSTLIAGLCGLADEALKTVGECLHSDNEATRLKAAIWLTERVLNTQIGDVDIRAFAEKECSNTGWGAIAPFSESACKRLLKEWGIDL